MLKVFTLLQSAEWDSTIKTFSGHDVYNLSGYVVPFAVHGDGEPMLFYYKNENIRAINVVMKRDISLDNNYVSQLPEGKMYDFATPYGYGGWLIEGEGDKSKLFEEYDKWCVENNIVSEFVRYNPIIRNYEQSCEYYETVKLGETVAMDISSVDSIWNNMTGKNRNMVRKAEKSGVTIKIGTSKNIYETFKSIYDKTMDRDDADEYYYFESGFYEALRNDLTGNARVFYALAPDSKIIAASIIMYCNGKMHYHLSGSESEYRNLAPTNLLLYKAALWGMENGYKVFHLGGGVGARQDGLFHFKKSFYRGETKDYFIGKRIFDPNMYKKLVDMRGHIANGGFFPLYRG